MRRVVVSEFVSLDGVFEDPGGGEEYKYGGWSLEHTSDEYGKFKYDELFGADVLLLGRVTYQGFAKAWPSMKGTGDFGERMNSLPKNVVSTTLSKDDLTWNNSHLINDNIVEEVQKLKLQGGQDILVNGSAKLVRSLMQYNLIDEYRLMVHPVILGEGNRLFDSAAKMDLKLVDTKVFTTGTVVLIYIPAGKE